MKLSSVRALKSEMRTIDEVRHAKESVQAEFGSRDWFRGVGIAPDLSGMVVRLNVDPRAKEQGVKLPTECEGVPVKIVYIKGYEPR
jgi:hypothetical protein